MLYGASHQTIFVEVPKVNSWTQVAPITKQTLYCHLMGQATKCEVKEGSWLTYCISSSSNVKQDNNLINYFIEKFREILGNYNVTLKEVKSESDITLWAVAHHVVNKEDNYLGGIVFQNDFNHLQFKIKLAKFVPSEMARFEYYHLYEKNYEIYYPLMAIQFGIWEAYLKTLENFNATFGKPNMSSPEIQMQPFEYPPYPKYNPIFISESPEFMSTSIVLGMTAVVYSIVRGPCSDKANYFKIYLHTMGISHWIYWSCWFLSDMIVQFGSVGLQILVLFFDFTSDNAGSIVKRGSIYIWTIFLILYCFACVSFCAYLSTFFKRGTLGTYSCATFFLLSYFFSELFYPSHIVNMSIIGKFAMCLVPNAALIWGVSLMLNTPGGITWSNIFTKMNEHSLSLMEVIYFLCADIVFYYILTIYSDKLKPKIGPPKPWYWIIIWPFSYVKKVIGWLKKISLKNHLEEDILTGVTFLDNPIIELNFVSKSFQHHTVGLDSTFLRVERGLRTIVVGYKGSGKSTLIHVICGNVRPDSGTVLVNGKSIRSLCKTSYEISVCFNEDYLCDDDTVLEHIILIGLLKGLKHKEAIQISKQFLNDMEIYEKRHRPTRHLLEVERKKLCIILACVGKSDIVLLDDPTEYIEDDLKPPIWDFIMKETRNRTLLMTSCSMDEAKYTGERIAVLERGKIITAGSLDYLGNAFYTGYHLVIKMTPNTERDHIIRFIQDYIPSAHEVNFLELKRFIETREDFPIMQNLRSPLISKTSVLTQMNRNPNTTPRVSKSSVYYDALDIDLLGSVSSQVSIFEIIKNELDDFSEFEGSLRLEIFNDPSDLVINLPVYAKSKYYQLLKVLENDESYTYNLGISNWSLREFTLEQAFSEVSRFMHLAEETSDLIDEGEIYVQQVKPLLETKYEDRLTPICASFQRLAGLLIKRVMWYWGHWHHLMIQTLIPLILVIITVRGTNYYFERSFDKSLYSHQLEAFPESIALIKSDATTPAFEGNYSMQVKKSRKVLGDFKDLADKQEVRPLDENTLSAVYVIGVKIEDELLTAMFSPSAFHAGPISIIVVMNTILKYLYPNQDLTISSQSQPIESQKLSIVKYINSSYMESVNNYMFNEDETYGIMLGFAFLIYASGFVNQALGERIFKLKHLQLNASLSRGTYWITMMIVDCMQTLILGAFFLAILIYLPTHKAFYGEEFAKYFLIFFGVAGYALTVQCYIASFIFRRTQTCYYAMLSYNEFSGLFIFVVVITLQGLYGEILAMTARIISSAFCAVSGFYSLTCLGILNNHCYLMADAVKEVLCWGSFDNITNSGQPWNDYLKQNNIDQSCCEQSCLAEENCKLSESFIQFILFQEGSLDRSFAIDLLFLVFHCILGTFILIFTEIGKARRIYHSGSKIRRRSMYPRNIRVIGREKRLNIRDVLVKNEHLSLLNSKNCYISAIYKIKGKGIILCNINLKIKPNETLVILGPKSSGKSTLMNILGGISYPSRGDIYYGGVPLYTKHSSEIKAQIGYCPDIPFLEKMSGIQYLKLFGRLRGIPNFQLNMHIKKWLTLLRFEKRAKDYIEVYSEGTKAKLRIAMALVGDSPILIFDEPTAHLNPIGKATFWRIINHLSHEYNKIIVVASSSIDDFAQNHCKKLGFLINGEIKEVLSPSEWKQQYGLSYTVIFQFKELQNNTDEDVGFKDFELFSQLKKQILHELPNSELREEQYNFQKYTVPSVGLRWAKIFQICEQIKVGNENLVLDYSINQTTLKDIYHFQAVKQTRFVPSPTVWEEFSYEFC